MVSAAALDALSLSLVGDSTARTRVSAAFQTVISISTASGGEHAAFSFARTEELVEVLFGNFVRVTLFTVQSYVYGVFSLGCTQCVKFASKLQ